LKSTSEPEVKTIHGCIEDRYELSPLQEGMLFHVLREPDASMYFQQVVTTMRGLNIEALEKTWQLLINRHSILRTSFHWEGLDRPLQMVHLKVSFSVDVLDWRNVPREEQKPRIASFLHEDRQRGFALDQAPLLRITIIRTDSNTFHQVRSHHHMLLDGWSGPIIFGEYRKVYEALRRGKEPELSETRPYGDYIRWLESQSLDDAEAYWRKKLKGFSRPTPLPEHSGNFHSRFRGRDRFDQRSVNLSKQATSAIDDIVRKHCITHNVLLQGAWALVLSRYSGMDDVCFGTLVSGRSPELRGVENMVGLFMNTLPVRVRIQPDESFIPWIQNILDQQIEMSKYEYSPLVSIQGWSEIRQGTPLFETLVIYENFPRESHAGEGIQARSKGSAGSKAGFQARERTNYPLTIQSAPSDELGLRVNFDKAYVTSDIAGRALQHLRIILEEIARSPERTLAEFSMVSDAERHRILVNWNESRVAISSRDCIYRFFEAQVDRYPDAIALVSEGKRLTYRELDAKSNQLAHHLLDLYVHPGDRVAVYLDRGMDSIISMLAILKAGCVYVPLDPKNSTARIQFMVGDSQATAVITIEAYADSFPEAIALVCIDSETGKILLQPDDRLDAKIESNHEACIIYTHSSKSLPLGVLIEHHSLSNLVLAQLPLCNLGIGDHALQLISPCLDHALAEVFRVLCSGAALYQANEKNLISTTALNLLLREHDITTITANASVLENLLDANIPALRTIIVVGRVTQKIVEQWGKGRKLISYYGFPETTTASTISIKSVSLPNPPIGRPLANSRVYILDKRKEVVPVGVTGDIYCAGDNLARGYLNRPDLTDACFIVDPFTATKEYMFRTGCSGRWRSDGQIELIHAGEDANSFESELDERDNQQLLEAFHYCHPGVESDNPAFLNWCQTLMPRRESPDIVDYWKVHLEGVEELELPLDRSRSAIRKQCIHIRSVVLQGSLLQKVRVFCKKEKLSLFAVMLSVYQALLGKYSRQDDVVVAIVGNCIPELGPRMMIGFFPELIPVRTLVNVDSGFSALVHSVQQELVAVKTHQGISFDRLLELSHIPHDTSRFPLCQAGFDLHLATGGKTPSGLFDANRGITDCLDLMLQFVDDGKQIMGEMCFNSHLWDDRTIERMFSHFIALLERVIEQPTLPIGEMSLISGEERHQVLVEWNQTTVDYSDHPSLMHQLVEAQVEKTPNETAVIYEEQSLTYREFNCQANRIAHRLQKVGIGPDKLVGIYAERSLDMVLALHATLKAGGGYVPLDPSLPKERLELIVQEAEIAVVLTQKHLQPQLMTDIPHVLVLDDEAERLCEEAEDNPSVALSANNLAYIIYTSGSTGTPKGVMLEHGGLCNRLLWMQDEYQLNTSDRVLQKTPFTFDVSVWEFFWPLITGASLLVAKPEGHRDPAYLNELIQQQEVTTLHFVPPMLTMFLGESGVEKCTSIRRVICSGEALSFDTQVRFFEKLPAAELHNLYGPTEASIDVTYWRCEKDKGMIPIGYPIANMQVYVLDEKLNPLPIGIPGELHLAGIGLARGYIKRPDLTDAGFIKNPFPETGNEKVYKTGDLCRWLPDGSLQYLGRIDHQVKIRGFRIELGEIEFCIATLPTVQQVMIVVQTDPIGGKRLVAYVVGDENTLLSAVDIKEHLQKKLPEYMIPSAFVFLEEFPLTANGKVNRRALPAPSFEYLSSGEGRELPAEATEIAVADIWKETLHLENIGRGDNFFELGGHSLLAMTVISRLRDTFEVDMPLRLLFDAPTVSDMAEKIRELVTNPDAVIQDDTPLESGAGDNIAPLSFSQQRMWFIAQLDDASAVNNTSTIVQINGLFDAEALDRTLTELLRRHDILRTTFDVIEGEPFQFIHPPEPADYATIDLRSLPVNHRQEEVKRMQNLEYSTPFDLVNGPVVRFNLVRMGETRQVVLIGIHHIVSDGWSFGVMAREIMAMYTAFREGRASPLPDLPVQYSDYVKWQRDKLGGGSLERQLSFWKKKLKDVERLELITDRPRSKIPSNHSAGIPVVIDQELTSSLHALCRQEETTMFMLLLSMFQLALGLYARQEDVCIGTVVAGRDRPELEGMIGVFINTLVFRGDFSGNPTLREILQREKQNTMDVFENMDLPFDMLVDELSPERTLGMQPIFQVLFVLENMPSQTAPGHKKTGSGGGKNLQVNSVTDVQMFFDMTLTLNDFSSELGGGLHYKTDLFDASTAESIAGVFMRLLGLAALNPDQRVSELELLDDQDKALLINGWNTSSNSISEQCIHTMFELRVDMDPDHTALVFDNEKISYQELDCRANQLAHELRHIGVEPEQTVVMILDRGISAIVTMLAIFKAGGVYVPLDPSLPEGRQALVVEDVQPAVIITDSSFESIALPELSHCTVLCIDKMANALVLAPQTRLKGVTPSNLAYIIYTSGSTGRPKGVMVEHRNIAHTVAAQIPLFGLNENSRVLQTISLSFDVSLGEIFRTLVAGGVLYLARREALLPGPDLITLLKDNRITTVTLSAAALSALPFEFFPDLAVITVGGEALPARLARQWAEGRTLINGYGPTETTIGSTVAINWDMDRKPPIGKPLANESAYVVNDDMHLMPIGYPGELYIGGDGVTRGYFQQPDLTAERFLPDPFTSVPGGRIYKTGDLVRWLSDGQLDFLGRVDEQVKIRGYRIEPGEINTLLGQHEKVQDSAVIALSDHGEDKYLVGYVVAVDMTEQETDAARKLVDEWEEAGVVAASNIDTNEIDDPKLNFKGWNSSYTREPIPISDMCNWADEAISRIRQYDPGEVFEIGCGTGLMLFRLAPYCRRYDGIDLSAGLIEVTRSYLHLLGEKCDVELKHRRADQLGEWSDQSYDCVFANSVIQYFPDVNYFLDVLQHAVRMTRDGGVVFIGDVRNFKLLEVFHAVIQLGVSPAGLSATELLDNIQRYATVERELLIDPLLFYKFASGCERITHVRIMPKNGCAQNELIDFRYDICLEIGRKKPVAPDCIWHDWAWEDSSEGMVQLRSILSESIDLVGVKGIPNARTTARAQLVAQLGRDDDSLNVEQLCEALQKIDSGVELFELVKLAREYSYKAEVSWLNCDDEGRFDVLFSRNEDNIVYEIPHRPVELPDWNMLANNPSEESLERDIIADIREYLKRQLPEYMVPSAFVFMDSIPLTSNGKVDRKALPVPDDNDRGGRASRSYVAPKTEAEKALADIWKTLLRVERVGIQDNFFELGGDSILCIRVIAQANELGLKLSTQDAYRYQTIEELAIAGKIENDSAKEE